MDVFSLLLARFSRSDDQTVSLAEAVFILRIGSTERTAQRRRQTHTRPAIIFECSSSRTSKQNSVYFISPCAHLARVCCSSLDIWSMLVLHLFFLLVCIHLREKTVTDRMSLTDSVKQNVNGMLDILLARCMITTTTTTTSVTTRDR